ncbi:vicilin [Morus notabilis]|uniref:vicilin n=1 Tax=Morus notabilis TaxID=981085 RepID=UPI000CECFB5D|nr:vicilin [Morus notabilis]
MAIKSSLPLFLLLSSLFVASFALSYDEENDQHRISPRQEYQQCQSRCQDQQLHGQERQLCQHRCEQQLREREREREQSEHGGRGRGSRESKERELREEFEQCRQDCERREKGQQQQQQCQRRCQQEYEERRREEQQREERERRRRQEGGRSVYDEEENDYHRTSPRQEYQQCQSRCQDQQLHGQERQLCQHRCEQQLREREREREQSEHGGRGGGSRESKERELREEFEQCRQDCERREKGQQQQQQCQRRCQQEYEERQREEQQREERERRRRQEGGRSVYDEEENDYHRTSPRQEYQQCQSRCQDQQLHGQERQLCQHRCEQQLRERGEKGQQQQQQCQRRCQQEYEERQREEQQREERERRRRQEGEKFRRCQQRCQEQQHVQERRRECQQECERKYREEERRERRRRDDDDDEEMYNPEREREGEEREREISPRSEGENPYHFRSHRLQSRYRTEEGHLKVLEMLSRRSELLKGLKNYRIVVLEANPNTFVVPHHCDADSVLVVTRGKGTISIVRQNNKESYNIERADVITVLAGSTVYLVNDQNEPLQITKLVTPVNIPGQFEEYYPGGGENPQSYFKAFSTNILKSTLSATEEQIERLIGEQREGRRQLQRPGFIKRASQEQLQALTQHASSPRRKGGRQTTGPISLHSLSPTYSNNYGKFYEATPEDNKQLEEMDVLVAWTDLKQGSIFVPHFNSKTTVLVMVVEGEGRMEMACPHLARQKRQQWGGREEEEKERQTSTWQYQKVTSHLSAGDVFIIPAGHPISVVASSNQNLRMVGFGVNARNNERTFIAGKFRKDNVIKQLEREAKELAFNMPGREVEQIFNKPKLSYFVPQESQEEESRQSHPLNSILNLAGFA